ncbi:hypothetical protein Fot_46133 [Forsythia ovata]|uniref:Uncharacterized protein n=1 Tax=Forsythia ovata TaxID=205694 RepID=A0ABD1QMH1_9LAMI
MIGTKVLVLSLSKYGQTYIPSATRISIHLSCFVGTTFAASSFFRSLLVLTEFNFLMGRRPQGQVGSKRFLRFGRHHDTLNMVVFIFLLVVGGFGIDSNGGPAAMKTSSYDKL